MNWESLCKSPSSSFQMEQCKVQHSTGPGLQQGDVQITSSQSYWLADSSTAKIRHVAADDTAELLNAAAGKGTGLLLQEIRQGDCGPHDWRAARCNICHRT